MSVGIGRERQFEIYVNGVRGRYPTVPVSVDRLEQAARKAMSPEGFAYVAGGAGTASPSSLACMRIRISEIQSLRASHSKR